MWCIMYIMLKACIVEGLALRFGFPCPFMSPPGTVHESKSQRAKLLLDPGRMAYVKWHVQMLMHTVCLPFYQDWPSIRTGLLSGLGLSPAYKQCLFCGCGC